jgi:hypothetical protein
MLMGPPTFCSNYRPNDTVPGPGNAIEGHPMSKSTDLKTRKAAAVPAGVGSRGIYVAKAENTELWDVDGRRSRKHL